VNECAALIVPSVRWHVEYGYALAEEECGRALALGVSGLLLHGGPLDETRGLLDRLRARNPAMFAAAELSGGTGEHFPGGTALPPLGAFDVRLIAEVRRAARLVAREARAAGITWAIGPSCIEPTFALPLERARAFAGDDADVAQACAEWIDGCQAEGVAAMPGPYPLMRASAAAAALDAGAAAVLLALDHTTNADTVRYLRHDVGFDGVICAAIGACADALGVDEDALSVDAMAAGCDLLLGVDDVDAVVRALDRASASGRVSRAHVDDALLRVAGRAQWSASGGQARTIILDDLLWARRIADAAVEIQRGVVPALRQPLELVVVDDDPPRYTAAGASLQDALTALGADVERDTSLSTGASRGTMVVALFGDLRIGLGFETFSDGAMVRVHDVVARATAAARDTIVVHFTPPVFGTAFADLPATAVLSAWSGTRAMEEAAARRLVNGRDR
jgi:hypothetical protein